MPKKVYVFRDGKFVETSESARQPQQGIVEDTFKKALRHPVTGKVYDSRSAYEKENKRLGLQVVGNDLLSQKKQVTKDVMTEEVIRDKMERAEAIAEDPYKLRQARARNEERLHLQERLLNGRR